MPVRTTLPKFLHSRLGYRPNVRITRGIGYKACGKYIVKLRILGITNESRRGIYSKRFAKFRTSAVRVIDIFPNALLEEEFPQEKITSISSDFDPNFIYTIGQFARSPTYNPDKNVICAEGLHYYQTLYPAQLHNLLKYVSKDVPVLAIFCDGQISHINKRYQKTESFVINRQPYGKKRLHLVYSQTDIHDCTFNHKYLCQYIDN